MLRNKIGYFKEIYKFASDCFFIEVISFCLFTKTFLYKIKNSILLRKCIILLNFLFMMKHMLVMQNLLMRIVFHLKRKFASLRITRIIASFSEFIY